ncbi:MAG: carbon-nitrogen hydrolase family protein [Candidatus Dormibacteria bacterium]
MSTSQRKVKVAAVQAAPVFLEHDATVELACDLIDEATGAGAQLVVFPEAFVPGYPDFVWRLPAWSDGDWYRRLADNAMTLSGRGVERLTEAARRAGVWVVIGINELSASGTLYNTLLYLSPEGELAGVHRKLMGTGGERTVWGQGDGSTLTVIDTPFGRLGGLTCWENYMPLARMAMYAQGVDIYVAPTWDCNEVWVSTLQHIAKEGRMYVVGVAACLRGSDVPVELRGTIYGGDDDWMCRGRSAIVGPDGDLRAGPLIDERGILYAELDLGHVQSSRREFDPIGHYARPDVFKLSVDTTARPAVVFTTEPALTTTPTDVPSWDMATNESDGRETLTSVLTSDRAHQ